MPERNSSSSESDMSPKNVAFEHFWSFVGHVSSEKTQVPLLDLSGGLVFDIVKKYAAFQIQREACIENVWQDQKGSFFVNRLEARNLHAKYYRLKASAAITGHNFHRSIASYADEKDPGNRWFVSVVAYYDTRIKAPLEVKEELRAFKPYARATTDKLLRAKGCDVESANSPGPLELSGSGNQIVVRRTGLPRFSEEYCIYPEKGGRYCASCNVRFESDEMIIVVVRVAPDLPSWYYHELSARLQEHFVVGLLHEILWGTLDEVGKSGPHVQIDIDGDEYWCSDGAFKGRLFSGV